MKTSWRSKKILIPALLMVTVIGTAAAASVLFSHTFPAISIPGVPALVTTACAGGTLITVFPATITAASGFIIFVCSGPTTPPFTTGAQDVTVAATGGLPTGYVDLYAVTTTSPLPSATKCSGITPAQALLSSNTTPGSTLTLTASVGLGLVANTAYVYCADYANTSLATLQLPTFTVTWQQ